MDIRSLFSPTSLVKLICSLPVLLVVLYFVPPLGVILTLARYFVYGSRHFYRAPALFLSCGLVALAPHGLELMRDNFGVNLNQQWLMDFFSHPMYPKITEFGTFLTIFSIVLLVASYLLKNIIEGISSKINQLMNAKMASEEKAFQENDLKLKEKAIDSAKSTPHAVKCPHCGTTNHVVGTAGTCKSCRSAIEWHEKKK